MIVIKLIGGLGNQLFQYSLGRRLATKLGVALKLDLTGFRIYKLHKYSLHHFNIAAESAGDEEVDAYRALIPVSLAHRILIPLTRGYRSIRGLPQATPPLPRRARDTLRRTYVTEPAHEFRPEVLNAADNTYLDGYWQDPRYFEAIEMVLRQDLAIITPPTPANVDLAGRIEATQSVSLHVRRADYVTNAVTLHRHGVCGVDYYRRCAAIIRERVATPTFFVFSDDPTWARNHLDLGAPTVIVDLNNADYNYEDLRLMSRCRHHVIANSSYSWWGAWLNPRPDKLVLAPSRWYAIAEKDNEGIIPPSWLRVSNTGD